MQLLYIKILLISCIPNGYKPTVTLEFDPNLVVKTYINDDDELMTDIGICMSIHIY